MVNFRRFVCIALMAFAVVFCCSQSASVLSPKGFFVTLGALFFTSMCVGFIWPDLPPEEDSQDE